MSIDLTKLPPPNVVEPLDFETILANNKQLLVALYPSEQQTDITQVLALESEPLTKLLQVFAYRELLLRARVNDAAKAVMLSYAKKTDLDQIGANFKVERLLGVDLDHIEAETLAGLVYETLKRVPEEEEVLEVEGLRIIIKKMKGPKIILAKVLMLD